VEDGRGQLCIARPRGAGPHAAEVLREAVALLGGKGGGTPELAQGGGPDASRLAEALELASSRMGGREERR
jgi:alanyl-tRNA synthetase